MDTLLVDYFGAADNSYTRAVSRKSMAAAIARVYRPGTKFDSVPILNGPQGIGKSTFYAKLADAPFPVKLQAFPPVLPVCEFLSGLPAPLLQGLYLHAVNPWEQIKGGWSDSDAAALKVYLSRNYGIYSPTKTAPPVPLPSRCQSSAQNRTLP